MNLLFLFLLAVISIVAWSQPTGDDNSNHVHRHKCHPTVFIPTMRIRDDLGDILRITNKRVGAELGVQLGNFANNLMRRWKKVDEYVMVDLWGHQEHYLDSANVDNKEQDHRYKSSLSIGNQLVKEGILGKLSVCRNFTTSCATKYPDNYFDFIYVDARHDYKGVLEDLRAWWPKLKMGGIFAGHDYTEQSEPYGADCPQSTNQDWTHNFDGTVDETKRVTKGAIDDFFSDRFGDMKGCPRQVTVSYRERAWNSWAAGK
jgi:hypothetical protein